VLAGVGGDLGDGASVHVVGDRVEQLGDLDDLAVAAAYEVGRFAQARSRDLADQLGAGQQLRGGLCHG
jgi:hypothetical protein